MFLQGNESPFVYKEVERAFWVPGDTEVLELELRNLELFRGNTVNIIQLVAAVISQNPYQTDPVKQRDAVLRGVLLEYHPNGTLEDALKSPKPETKGRWCQWALHIAAALAEMHGHELPHMDLKPSNIVINADFHAILIDISGIGGYIRQWLSPEMFGNMKHDVRSWSIRERKQNDIWAFERILLAMADACLVIGGTEEQLFRNVAQVAARPLPRISLSDAITALSEPRSSVLQYMTRSTSLGSNPPSVLGSMDRLDDFKTSFKRLRARLGTCTYPDLGEHPSVPSYSLSGRKVHQLCRSLRCRCRTLPASPWHRRRASLEFCYNVHWCTPEA